MQFLCHLLLRLVKTENCVARGFKPDLSQFLVYYLRLSDYPLLVVTWMARTEMLETVLEGRMGCVSLMCIHLFAVHS